MDSGLRDTSNTNWVIDQQRYFNQQQDKRIRRSDDEELAAGVYLLAFRIGYSLLEWEHHHYNGTQTQKDAAAEKAKADAAAAEETAEMSRQIDRLQKQLDNAKLLESTNVELLQSTRAQLRDEQTRNEELLRMVAAERTEARSAEEALRRLRDANEEFHIAPLPNFVLRDPDWVPSAARADSVDSAATDENAIPRSFMIDTEAETVVY